MKVEARAFAEFDFAIFASDRDVFITSDAPCVWFDAEAYKRPPMFQGIGLGYESVEITLPVSPRQIILLNRRGASGYFPAFDKLIDEFNRRTRFECNEHFINNKNETNPHWFDPGVEPDDSWEKMHPAPDADQDDVGQEDR
jgi:hypothetical protein